MFPIQGAIRILFLAVATLLLAATTSNAQVPVMGLTYHPGDKVRVTVTFKAPVAASQGTVRFDLQGQPLDTQQGFPTLITGSEFKKISDTQCEISSTIPDFAASGTYRLRFVVISVGDANKSYVFGSDFTEVVSIQVADPKRVQFPEIGDITVNP
jgi:hypothetical protein